MILLKNGKLDMAWWLLFSEPVGIHLCDIATAGHMNKKIYNNIQICQCVPMCVSKHIHCNSHTHIQLSVNPWKHNLLIPRPIEDIFMNVVRHYIHSYSPTLTFLPFYRCLLNYRAKIPLVETRKMLHYLLLLVV